MAVKFKSFEQSNQIVFHCISDFKKGIILPMELVGVVGINGDSIVDVKVDKEQAKIFISSHKEGTENPFHLDDNLRLSIPDEWRQIVKITSRHEADFYLSDDHKSIIISKRLNHKQLDQRCNESMNSAQCQLCSSDILGIVIFPSALVEYCHIVPRQELYIYVYDRTRIYITTGKAPLDESYLVMKFICIMDHMNRIFLPSSILEFIGINQSDNDVVFLLYPVSYGSKRMLVLQKKIDMSLENDEEENYS